METILPDIITAEGVWLALENVKDPEIPVLSVVDMGIITEVKLQTARDKQTCTITLTPTFVGCPAIEVMKKNIGEVIKQLGFDEVTVNTDFKTQWTTQRMNPEAKMKLEKFGIAPPPAIEGELTLEQLNRVRCPHCGSTDTTLRSSFGSTLCRAIRFCFTCRQSFEQFKPI